MNGLNTEWLQPIVDEQPFPMLFATISGAHLYGFPSADSDYDLRGVHVAPLRDVIGLRPYRETIEASGVRDGIELDLVTHDALKFFRLLLKRNGYVLEQLTSPLVVRTSAAHQALLTLVPKLVTRNHAHHYLGFVRTQWRLFLADRRVKPLLYTYRVLLTGIHLMRTGCIEANILRLNETFRAAYIDELVAQKVGGHENVALTNADVAFHEAECERLTRLLESARESSALPEAPSALDAMNDLLIRIREGDLPCCEVAGGTT
ncbi:MAG TPA: nucleotidyltransferase domain-containing protein [Phycisphaerae bacterium]|nr:nucleotidyltransferase domain-containing protein [Phycisphaerae bacterium]HRW51379.1 nucleotidyltransferase domain-containing protein [Phycisphaerae bacterium]